MVRTSYNPDCVVMYSSQYGQLVSWDKAGAHCLDIIGFPRAVLLFEAQHELSEFLRKMVDLIRSKSTTGPISGRLKLDALAHNGFALKDGWTTQLHAAQDELWLLQTDPAYLHQKLNMLDGSAYMKYSNEARIQETRVELAMKALVRIEDWQWFFDEAEAALKEMRKSQDPVKPGKPLPHLYEIAFTAPVSKMARSW
ncbi:hypothetical protein AC579_6986 [Pseudocercospora musae]|uniref:Uncharacterized protein n=1 Tax=Pseudocercospora musae TaxID=113226 RepID=A0A139IAY8_9PEZI|nr:hypothetical protein AC579_6986 [Pseudocercospora musae]